MTYQQPKVLVSGSALKAVQGQGQKASDEEDNQHAVTVGAYDADE